MSYYLDSLEEEEIGYLMSTGGFIDEETDLSRLEKWKGEIALANYKEDWVNLKEHTNEGTE